MVTVNEVATLILVAWLLLMKSLRSTVGRSFVMEFIKNGVQCVLLNFVLLIASTYLTTMYLCY